MTPKPKICPNCGRRLGRPDSPDVVYSKWTGNHYCAGRRFARCEEIRRARRRRERRSPLCA